MQHLLAVCTVAVPVLAGAQPVAEYDLKAAFVYNFAVFTEWPVDTSFDGGSLNICVTFSSPMRGALHAMNGKPIKGRRVAVRTLTPPDPVQACHLLVLDATDRQRWLALLDAADGKPILTVADDPDGVYEGSMISLRMEGGRIAFDVDNLAVRRAGLTLSSKLLRLARTVL
jgi:hypothetical protein